MEDRHWVYQPPLAELIERRDRYEAGTDNWDAANEQVSDWIEARNPLASKKVLCIDTQEIHSLHDGFSAVDTISLHTLNPFGIKQSLLYKQSQCSPMEAYVVIRYQDVYYFAQPYASGNALVQLVHMPVTLEHQDDLSVSKSCLNAIRQFMGEQLRVPDSKVERIRHLGYLKSSDDNETNVFGVVYEITLSDDQFEWDGAKTFRGSWIHTCDLTDGHSSLDSWTSEIIQFALQS